MRIKSRPSGLCFLSLCGGQPGYSAMNAPDKHVPDPASPLDLWEMSIVAWIRLSASTAHAFAAVLMPRREAARSEPDNKGEPDNRREPDKERILAEKQELLLHVLE